MRYFFVLIFLLGGSIAFGQASPKMDFETYNPVSTLVVPEHKITRAKFPFIDVHNHQFRMGTMDLDTLIMEMEKLNMQVMVNLSGRGGEELVKMVENIKANEPKRFIVFTNINFNGVGGNNLVLLEQLAMALQQFGLYLVQIGI